MTKPASMTLLRKLPLTNGSTNTAYTQLPQTRAKEDHRPSVDISHGIQSLTFIPKSRAYIKGPA